MSHSVSSELCRSNQQSELGKLGLPTVWLFNGFWYHFSSRVEQRKPDDLAALQQAISEFGNLVGSYDKNCIIAVFERLPQDLQGSLTPQVRSSLNAFQQRFVHFLQDYQEFLKDLIESGVIHKNSPLYFTHPKPL